MVGVEYLLYLSFNVFLLPIESLKPEDVDRSKSWQVWKGWRYGLPS